MNKLDNLFSKKLAEHSTRSSERANELFLSRLAKQKKVVFWTPIKRNFAAAASVVLLGGLGYYASLDQEKVNLAQNQPATNLSMAETPKKTNKVPTQSLDIINANALTNEKSELVFRTLSEKVVGPIGTVAKVESTEYTDKLKSLSQDESVDYLNPQVAAAVSRPDTRALQPAEEAASDELKTDDDTFIIISPIDTYASNDVWDIPSILDQPSLDNALILEDHQERLLTKIYDEVKQLKKGQHLDLSKFGFKSLEDMALSEEGFIVTEAKKIKSKLQWIKSKINN